MEKEYKVMNNKGVIKIVNASELPKYIAMGWTEVKETSNTINPYGNYSTKK